MNRIGGIRGNGPKFGEKCQEEMCQEGKGKCLEVETE